MTDSFLEMLSKRNNLTANQWRVLYIASFPPDEQVRAWRRIEGYYYHVIVNALAVPQSGFDDHPFVGMDKNPNLAHLFSDSPMLSQGDTDNAPMISRNPDGTPKVRE